MYFQISLTYVSFNKLISVLRIQIVSGPIFFNFRIRNCIIGWIRRKRADPIQATAIKGPLFLQNMLTVRFFLIFGTGSTAFKGRTSFNSYKFFISNVRFVSYLCKFYQILQLILSKIRSEFQILAKNIHKYILTSTSRAVVLRNT